MSSQRSSNGDLIESIQHKINDYISGSKEAGKSIRIVYVFGSIMNSEKFHARSDVDLDFLVDDDLYNKDPLSASATAYMAATEIGLMVNRQTDVIILNSASYETAYQAITTGRTV